MRVLSLFSGIGGLDLGLERAGMTVVGQCEIDPFARAVLAKHWPGVPCWDDVREVTGDEVARRCGPVDVVCGGFPCQDISCAGKGAGLGGERSGLWWEMRRVIEAVRPAWVLAENVPALRTRGADDALAALEGLGYACWPLVVGAWAVGAPHRRDRVWIVGRVEYAEGEQRRSPCDSSPGAEGWGPTEPARASTGLEHPPLARLEAGREGLPGAAGGDVADAALGGREPGTGLRRNGEPRRGREPAGAHQVWPSRPGEPQHRWEPPRLVARLAQPRLGGDADGLPARLVSLARRSALRAYGNSVVPDVAEAIGRVILEAQETQC